MDAAQDKNLAALLSAGEAYLAAGARVRATRASQDELTEEFREFSAAGAPRLHFRHSNTAFSATRHDQLADHVRQQIEDAAAPDAPALDASGVLAAVRSVALGAGVTVTGT